MKFIRICIAALCVWPAECGELQQYETEEPIDESTESAIIDTYERKYAPYKTLEEQVQMEIGNEDIDDTLKKPCSIIVVSNIQHPNMQSLLRKYRYDSNGLLIPNSVKYFIKLPQGMKSNPRLMPLNDKAFSPLGGFIRYYKEVPPIPHAHS